MNKFMLNETSYHGAGAIAAVPQEVQNRGFKKVFVATDPDLIKFGVAAKVTDLLDKAGIDYAVYSDIKANPTIENVQNGVAAFKAAQADLKQSQKDLRQVYEPYDNAMVAVKALNDKLYTNQSLAALNEALSIFGENPSQLRIEYETVKVEAALEGLEIIGDVKADGNVNILDFIKLKKSIAEQTELTGYAYDTNLNEVLDTDDLVQLQKYLLDVILTFKD